MRVLDLFSGIGGFSLGLERAGMTTVAFCEIDPFCRKVLAKHWPHVPIYDDVRSLNAERLQRDGIAVDVICGGFPCQDISVAGKGAGIDGERSGLWKEYARLIGELRPRYVIVENVAALLGRGLSRVLGDLAEVGYDTEWHCIPASHVGAPHRRDRLWIVAHPRHAGICERGGFKGLGENGELATGISRDGAQGCGEEKSTVLAYTARMFRNGGDDNAGSNQESAGTIPEPGNRRSDVPDTHGAGLERQRQVTCRVTAQLYNVGNDCRWTPEPAVGRVAHGVPRRVDRLRSLGNAVVPQIPELIGRAIMGAI